MTINIDDLQKISNIMLDHLKEIGYEEIELQTDYYWFIDGDDLYNPASQPNDLTLGQLSDEWDNLQTVLDPSKYPITHYLIWLSAIFRAIGEHAANDILSTK